VSLEDVFTYKLPEFNSKKPEEKVDKAEPIILK
jgi:hypothetical protein